MTSTKLSPAQQWARKRNQAKGQFHFILGTADSLMDNLEVLSVGEGNTIRTIQKLIEDNIKEWEKRNSESKERWLQRYETENKEARVERKKES